MCWERFRCLKKKVDVPPAVSSGGRAGFAVDMDNKGSSGSMVVTAISRDNGLRTVLAGATLPLGDGPVVRIGHHVLPSSTETRAGRRRLGGDVRLDQARMWVALAGSGSLLMGLGLGYWWGSRKSSAAFPPKRESPSAGSAAAYVLREETPMTELQSPAAAASMATPPTRVSHVYYSHHHGAPEFGDSHAFRPVYPSSDHGRGEHHGGGATRRPRRYRGYPSRYMPMDVSDGEGEDVQPLALFTGR